MADEIGPIGIARREVTSLHMDETPMPHIISVSRYCRLLVWN